MEKFNLLECTLRDGGYIVDWEFGEDTIKKVISGLVQSKMDYVEVGYLNRRKYISGTSLYNNIEQIKDFLPNDRGESIYLAMADVQQFFPSDITKRTGESIDGIRVVFYKHQIKEAYELARAVKNAGYLLFIQPMVTIDYTIDEYVEVVKLFADLEPYAVSIVDSFGYMTKADFRRYFRVIDNIMDSESYIGFHSHNNMNLAFVTAQDIFDYDTQRKMIIDCSLYGMGRGAGNLHTELIANYYNVLLGQKYDCIEILKLISKYIMPISKNHSWGYSPYLFLTGLKHYHPNFACYLLEKYPDTTVEQFSAFLDIIPNEMKTKCKKDYVITMWNEFQNRGGTTNE